MNYKNNSMTVMLLSIKFIFIDRLTVEFILIDYCYGCYDIYGELISVSYIISNCYGIISEKCFMIWKNS